jgi:hypothetical protein
VTLRTSEAAAAANAGVDGAVSLEHTAVSPASEVAAVKLSAP